MMRYKCNFPGCEYSTTDRHMIDEHHIVPKSMGGSDKKSNLIMMCPMHHREIHVPGMINGHHAKSTDESIVIISIIQSTHGDVMQFKKVSDGKEYGCYLRSGEIFPWL